MQFVRGGPDVPERLLQAHEDGRVVFFCGAGISYPAGLPGFSGLVDDLYSRLEISPNPVQAAAIKSGRYDTAVGLLEANIVGGRATVREKIAEILEPDTSAAGATATHEALLRLAECRERRIRLITTNFDRLFEHVISNRRLSVERFEAPMLPIPKQRWDGLAYLHGLLPENLGDKSLDNLVVSSGDFGLAYLTERWAARFVGELLRNFIVCFVGYSIEDPVLRYMMDALAADQLRGEAAPEMFAFGSYSRGGEDARANEWRAKNVTPILYREHRRHSHLHRTLRAWADTYRDGTRGKERIVTEYAMARPNTATGQDDFVSRMLWALSDPGGLPARRFADLNPVPSLDWLEPLSEDRFGYADLIRFGVPPKVGAKEELAFSLMRRPAPYNLASKMALSDWDACESRLDGVMWQLARWLIRHLGNPALLLWLVKQGGRLHEGFAEQIASRMQQLAELEDRGESEKLYCIRKDAPDAVPDPRMRTLWGLMLAGRVKLIGPDRDLYEWRGRFERDGLTTALRLELREMLSPRVSLREPFRLPFGEDEGYEEARGTRQLVDWNIDLSTSHVHIALRELDGDENWIAALPKLLADFTGLLRDALDLMSELGGAGSKSDRSYVSQPSISAHPQNSTLRDWTALIDLNRDAWLATANASPDQARLVAESWFQAPYPLFRRLAFFTAAQTGVVPAKRALKWLLADNGWWLWSDETLRESMRLLVVLASELEEDGLAMLQSAILTGPPRDMYQGDIDEERWTRIQESEVWLRLAKIRDAGAQLDAASRDRLGELSAKHPDWRLAEDERDEFSTWTGKFAELRTHVATPRDQGELIQWLRENPTPDDWRPDDWQERCQVDYGVAISALAALAAEGAWPAARWREALYQWSDDEQRKISWSELAPLLANVSTDTLRELSLGLSWWLWKLAKTFDGQETVFLALCDRLLGLNHGDEDEASDDLVGHAINHPVGHVTEALLDWWYRNDLMDQQGLDDEPRRRFTQLCDTTVQELRHGRVLLAAHVISLFRVDREWTEQFMLPLFDWKSSEVEARAAWEGFLWSPRLYPPLMEKLKPAFLDTARHYLRLGRHRHQYASLLTFAGLEPRDTFRSRELALSVQALPQEALDHAAGTLVHAVDSAGDQRADYWKNRVAPFLRSIWPKTPDAISAQVSESLARACVAAGDAFPEALAQTRSWLRPLQYPDRVAHFIHEAQLDARVPEAALQLLDLVVEKAAKGYFHNLPKCLNAIRATEPEFELDQRFERLKEVLRVNGGDLN
ncbi:MAG: SIR2 family protein [Rhodospirillales bacterium]|nr:SIR2 family protein [Rhodospirillales bacterium]